MVWLDYYESLFFGREENLCTFRPSRLLSASMIKSRVSFAKTTLNPDICFFF